MFSFQSNILGPTGLQPHCMQTQENWTTASVAYSASATHHKVPSRGCWRATTSEWFAIIEGLGSWLLGRIQTLSIIWSTSNKSNPTVGEVERTPSFYANVLSTGIRGTAIHILSKTWAASTTYLSRIILFQTADVIQWHHTSVRVFATTDLQYLPTPRSNEALVPASRKSRWVSCQRAHACTKNETPSRHREATEFSYRQKSLSPENKYFGNHKSIVSDHWEISRRQTRVEISTILQDVLAHGEGIICSKISFSPCSSSSYNW